MDQLEKKRVSVMDPSLSRRKTIPSTDISTSGPNKTQVNISVQVMCADRKLYDLNLPVAKWRTLP